MSPKEKVFMQFVAEGFYSIDAEGNVWIERPRSPVRNFTRRIMSLFDMKGYLRIMFRFQGKQWAVLHHRIVYIHHHGDIPAGMHINHIDGNRVNNHISNLEAVTPRENILHAYNVIRTNKAYGENNPHSKLKETDVLQICRMRWKENRPYKEIAEKYGISRCYTSEICNLRRWRHLWRSDGKVAGIKTARSRKDSQKSEGGKNRDKG
ncbi:MAG: HNH endonuclease [Candidatus Latescibacterota bacterium]